MNLFARREQKPRFFIQTQGFEKRYIRENLGRYFGYDIQWCASVDMETGLEGLELYSPLHEQSINVCTPHFWGLLFLTEWGGGVVQIIVSRMKADAAKQHRIFLERRKTAHGSTSSLVDQYPHVAAAMAPHLDLFPPLDNLFQPSLNLTPRALPDRQCHSAPSTPFLAPRELELPPVAPTTAKSFDEDTLWVGYGEPDYWAMDAGVPQLRFESAADTRPFEAGGRAGLQSRQRR
ncbi:hypothetical protein FN846DRAFT_987001 [Sphaerosporella brunnea]|uniref:Uncharacterized protein n=1 Tax=Sphaerosporella brunnea TaxID=1250544 RepID=A0A5J5ESB5_9PEZI|nr:hypothetical protein FN846DRAFT_987001 [Sphaerosporella brunnea]